MTAAETMLPTMSLRGEEARVRVPDQARIDSPPVSSATSPRQSTRVLLVDDHPMWLEALRVAVEAEPHRVVVGAVRSGRECVTAARSLRPDVVVLDVNLPDSVGPDNVRRVLLECPNARILMLTVDDDLGTALECLQAGARGYLLKGSRPEDIMRTLDVVSSGHAVLDLQLSEQLIAQMASTSRSQPPFPELTDRERAVLELIADGRKNAAIASELGLSLKTVRNYVSRIFVKIHVADRAEAVVAARRAGLGR